MADICGQAKNGQNGKNSKNIQVMGEFLDGGM